MIKLIIVTKIQRKALAEVNSSFFVSIKPLFAKYDCIYYHTKGPCVMLFIPNVFHIRTVATIHGLDWQRSKWGGFATWHLKLG